MDHSNLFQASAGGLAVAGLASLPAVIAIVSQIRNRTPKDNFYEDKDGVSKPEDVAAFSQKASKFAIVFLAATTAILSLAVSVLSTVRPGHGDQDLYLQTWLTTGAWLAILVQAACLAAVHLCTKVWDLGAWIFLSTTVNIIVSAIQTNHLGQIQSLRHDITLILRLVILGTAAFLAFASVLIPRRPLVYYNDEIVDENFGITAWNRNTWGWGRKILDLGGKNGDLQQKDVPRPSSYARSKSLVEHWESVQFDGTLFRNLLYAYGHRFAFQWTASVFRILIGLGPYVVMLKLIETLETMPAEDRTFGQLWRYVFGLAAFTITENWVEGWLNWYAIGGMAIPISAQLSALVFEKSLRRKNVKMAEKNDTEDKDDDKKKDAKNQKDDAKKAKDAKDAKSGKKNAKKDDDDPTVLKSRQAIVNLVGVDSRRIADFLAMHYFVIHSIAKLIVYSIFLIQLIGFKPFSAGFLAWAIVLPINTYCSKIYLKTQDKFMKVRDEKLAVVNEALLGIRQIKFSALEKEWSERILAKRNKELSIIRRLFIIDTVLSACWVVSPILLAVVALSTYTYINGGLSASVAFVSIGIFKSLEVSLSVLPEFIGFCLDTLVSIRRVGAYLSGPEIKRNITDGHDVAFDNASIAWPVDSEVPEEDRFVLRNLNLSFPRGELSVISGKTGTGKSLLLSSLLGEADLLDGAVLMPPSVSAEERNDSKAHPGNWMVDGAVAYVGQTPWLESASFRDNILFGLPFDEERYNHVIDVCALKKDLDILTDGDKTELGANGINLSGGQKWRVTLARCVYSRAEILVMDDIFSAVDAHVGRQIFDKCIAGPICKGRTVILVTHHVALVNKKTKYLVELGEGTAIHAGLTSDLEEDGTLQKIKSNGQTEAEIQAEERSEPPTMVNSEEASDAEEEAANALQKVASKQDAKKFIEDETHEKGSVKRKVYGRYLNASGGLPFWITCVFLYIGYEVGNVGRNWWLQIWTGGKDGASSSASISAFPNSTSSANPFYMHGMAGAFSYQHGVLHVAGHPSAPGKSHPGPESPSHSMTYYLSIYALIAFASAVVGCLRIAFTYYMSLKASRILFREILYTVVRTPLRWLDTVPVGRILNRMTADFDVIDNRIAGSTSFFVSRCLGLVAICAASTLVTPYVLPLAGVLVCAAAVIGKKYMDGARPMKRLESSSKSPVFELFNATLAGVSTLRAFSKTDDYIRRMHYSLDTWNTNRIHFWIFNRWMGLRMALIGTLFTTSVGLLIVITPSITAAMAGFSLSFALDFATTTLFAIRAYANLELDMNAAERVVEYSELKMEKQDGEEPSAAWPTSGTMKVEDLVVGYAEGLPAVLKGISFEVANNERVGVIGRTGAGKSSLTLALFRFLEARSGKVSIDGVDISKIDLHSLRSRLAIIPQDPVLFSGTVRSNLDPFDHHTDEELRECLARVHLLDSEPATPANEPSSSANSTIVPNNVNIFRDLNSGISESGGNLSQGQRQLLCIARSIVARPKIMVLDEATSAVDMATDASIQRSIREEFTDSTLLVIAHRLSTIADFDKILVLSEGLVAEYGTPTELWNKEGGIFRDMCEHSGERDKLEETIMGKK